MTHVDHEREPRLERILSEMRTQDARAPARPPRAADRRRCRHEVARATRPLTPS